MTLENRSVPCTGQVRQVRVRGNMPWTAEMDAQTITDAINEGYLTSVDGSWSGNDTDAFIDGEQLSFNTAKQDIRKGNMTSTITFKHATNDRVAPVEKEIQLMGCLITTDGSGTERLYEVYGPVLRTWYEKTMPYTDEDNNAVEGASMIDNNLALALRDAGLNDTQLTLQTDFIAYWTVLAGGEAVPALPGKTYTGTNTFTTNIVQNANYHVTEYVLMTGPLQHTVEASQAVLLIGPPAYTSGVSYTSQVGFRVTGDIIDRITIGQIQKVVGINQWDAGGMHFPIQTIGTRAVGTLLLTPYTNPNYTLAMIRHGVTQHISTEQCKNTKYKTYYVKEIN